MSTKVASAAKAAPAKGSKKSAPKAATKKATKKSTKKATTKASTTKSVDDPKADKNRVFYLLGDSIKPSVDVTLLPDHGGKYKGKPMQAAKKAFHAITRRCTEGEEDAKFIFSIQEFTAGSKMSRFTYEGSRVKRSEPHKIVKAGKEYFVRYDTSVKAYKPASTPAKGTKKSGKKASTKKASRKKVAPKIEPEVEETEEGVEEEETNGDNGEENGHEEEGGDEEDSAEDGAEESEEGQEDGQEEAQSDGSE
jgi:hypothetical protein